VARKLVPTGRKRWSDPLGPSARENPKKKKKNTAQKGAFMERKTYEGAGPLD